MKSQIKFFILISFLAGLALQSCDEIEVLLPPDDSGEGCGDASGEGNGLIYLVNNSVEDCNANQEATNIASNNIGAWLTDNGFATYNATAGGLTDLNGTLPLWLGNNPVIEGSDGDVVNIIQPVPSGMDQTDFVGAFDQVAQTDWQVGSNWWNLDPQNVDYGWRGLDNTPDLVVVEQNIRSDQTWTKDNKYFLSRQIFVKEGATLTIEPGTVIFGNQGVGTLAGVLSVNRGARIIAEGTPEEPIVFTSTKMPGARARGDWGGLVLCGRAWTNKGTGDILIEGIEGDEVGVDGVYGPGGNDGNVTDFNDESSGVIRYVRLEFAGVSISPGNEVNSITCGSIGSGTQIDHVIVTSAGDDGIECFGGTVDLRYVAMADVLDDDLDLDQGYSGTIQYAYLVRNPFAADESTSTSFETSSSKSAVQPVTSAVASNVTIVGPVYQLEGTGLAPNRLYDGGFLGKDNVEVTLLNSIIIGSQIAFQNIN